jgi:hypothetical protein
MRMEEDNGALFTYGSVAGSAAVFDATKMHASVLLPSGADEVMKLALFFVLGKGKAVAAV